MSEPKQRWKIRPARAGEWLYVDSLAALGDAGIEPSSDGNEYELVSVWMTDEEVDALGEFGGW